MPAKPAELTTLNKNSPNKSDSPSYQPQEQNEDHSKSESDLEIAQNPQDDSVSLEEASPEKGNKFFIILLLLLYIIDLAPIGGMGYYMFEYRESAMKEKQNPASLRFMSANLNADPIMDMKIIEKGSTCPAGFEPLKLGTWPGTQAGCLCENGDLYGMTCEQLGSEKCQKDIPSTPPIDLYEWKKSILCVKRAVYGIDYMRNSNCPMKFKKCYFGGCFKGSSCPITKVDIDEEGDLFFARKEGELPLVNVQITLGDLPCFSQDLDSQNVIKNSSYELALIKENKCDRYGFNTHESKRIASQIAFNSFVENSFPSSVMQLPHFQENAKKTPAILSSINRMKIVQHDSCREINDKILNSFTKTWQNYTSWIFLVLLLYFIFRIVPLCQIFCYLYSRWKAVKESKDSEALVTLSYRLNLLSLLPTVVAFIFFYILEKEFGVLKEYFEEYHSLDCFAGSQGSMVISDYMTMIKNIGDTFWVEQAIIFSSISSCLLPLALKFGIV